MVVAVINKFEMKNKVSKDYMLRHIWEEEEDMPIKEIKKAYYQDYFKTKTDIFVTGKSYKEVADELSKYGLKIFE